MRGTFFCFISGTALLFGACGANTVAPLDIHPGLTREQTVSALRHREYCQDDIPMRRVETFHQCHRPGGRSSTSWIVVEYVTGVLHKLQRFERYSAPTDAAKRWNDLVTERSKRDGPISQSARDRLQQIRGVPDGAISWATWASGDSRILIGVYRLRKKATSDPDIMEELLLDPGVPTRSVP